MKKLAAVLFFVCLCISISVLYPQVATSEEMVNDDTCLECHELGTFGVDGLHGTHTDCAACHEGGVGQRGNVSSAACIECHPIDDPGECQLVDAHENSMDYDPADQSCLECHAETCEEPPAGCVVTIDCEATELCPDDECTTCTATTECDGMEADGVYSWSLDMAGITGDNGTVEICPDDLELGDNTLMVVDTANDDAEDTETLTLEECGPTDCQIDVIPDSLPKSHWTPLPAVFRIETIGIEDLNLLTPVNIVCEGDGERFPSITKTGKVVLPNLGTNTTVILQTGIVWPAILTQTRGLESETCTVTVGDCPATDTFELEYRFFFGIPFGN